MRPAARIAIVYLLFFALQNVHAAQPGTLVPVKADTLSGTRLVLKDAKCSLDLPGAGWKWMTADGSPHNFFCVNASTAAQFLIAIGNLHMEFSDHQPQSLIANAKAAIAKRGGKIENDKFEWIEVPGMKKTVRVTFQEIEAAGTKTLVVIYISNPTEMVSLKIQFTGAGAAAEPDALKQLVKSLQALKGDEKAK